MKTYTIEQGNHSASGLNFKIHSGLQSLSFSAILNENCLYDLGNNNNMDINKIYGITWGFQPEKNSFRIGWNCYKQNGLIQYFYYIHNNFTRNPVPSDPYDKTMLFEALPGLAYEHRFNISFEKTLNRIGIYINEDSSLIQYIPFNFSGVPTYGVYNHPYFGGDETAPHNMTLIIE
jgi:hypothetical protein